MNFTCRTCLLKVNSTNCVNIFTQSCFNEIIANLIANFAFIKLYSEDSLPKTICVTCLQRLNDCLKFKELIVNSDVHLREISQIKEEKSIDTTLKNLKVEETISSEEPLLYVGDDGVDVEQKEERSDQESTDHSNVNKEISVKVFEDVGILDKEAKKPLFTCKECNEGFRSKYSYASHKIIHTGNVRFSCEICGKRFPVRWALNNHIRRHSELRPYKCNQCDKSYKFPSNLITHRHQTHEGIKPFKCKTCSKTFGQRTSLICHEQTHTKVKQFTCDICSKSFHTHPSLTNHLRTHKDSSNVLCPICKKSYCYKGFKKHFTTHSGEKPYNCEVCSKSFSSRACLKIHMRIHEGIKPYTCDICEKSFRQSSVLGKHKRVHTGETPFPCSSCDKKFAYKHHLKKHVEKQHFKDVKTE